MLPERRLGPVASAAALCWIILVWAVYWPPFAFSPRLALGAFTTQGFPLPAACVLEALAVHAVHALATAMVLLAARGAGRLSCRILPGGARVPFVPFCLGLVLMGSAGLGLGLAGLLHPAVLWAVLLAASAAGGIPRLRRLLPEGTGRFAVLLATAAVIPALFGALAPEVTYDALAYHVGAPLQYLKLHRIVRFEHMFFTDLPLGLQMIYMFAVGTGAGDSAAKLLHWFLGVACLGAAARLGEAAGGKRGATWALAFLAATPFVATQMMKANVDLGVMLFTSAGVLALLGSRGTGGLLAAGICLGAAASVKLTGGIGVATGLLVLLLRPAARGASPAIRAVTFLAGAAIPLVAWLARSWLFAGNPVYPFLTGTLGGVGWTAENSGIYRYDMTGPTSFNVQYPGVIARFAGPWLMFMHDRGSEAAFGPFVLALAPLAAWLIAAGRGAATRALGLFSLAYWLAWFAAARDPRFFLPAWPVACAFAAALVTAWAGKAGLVARLAFVLAAAFAPFFASYTVFRVLNPGPVVWGAVTRAFYLDRLVPPPSAWMRVVRAANETFAGGGRVLVVGDVKAAGLAPFALCQSMFDTPHIVAAVREANSPERLAVWFRQHGVRAIIYNVLGSRYLRRQFGEYSWTEREGRMLREFWRRRLVPVHEVKDGGSAALGLYAVTGAPGPRLNLPIPGEER